MNLSINKILQGNALKVLKTLPDNSIDCSFSSPPYWNLRNYETDGEIWDEDENCEHDWSKETKRELNLIPGNAEFKRPWREQATGIVSNGSFCKKCKSWRGELGMEPTVDLFIKHLVNIFTEVMRVLKPSGSCFVNLGDTYMNNSSYYTRGRQGYGKDKIGMVYKKDNTIKQKSLCLIPYRFAIEMIERGFIIRNIINWRKPNALPSGVNDRFTVDSEPIFFITKEPTYYFKQQFEPYTNKLERWGGEQLKVKDKSLLDEGNEQETYRDRSLRPNAMGKNKRTTWDINVRGFSQAHFATFNEKLVKPILDAACPKYVCKKCGKPREEIIEYDKIQTRPGNYTKYPDEMRSDTLKKRQISIPKVKGLTDCGCGVGFEPGIILDPFIGSGTVGMVAKANQKNFIGIELNPTYIKMAEDRIKQTTVQYSFLEE